MALLAVLLENVLIGSFLFQREIWNWRTVWSMKRSYFMTHYRQYVMYNIKKIKFVVLTKPCLIKYPNLLIDRNYAQRSNLASLRGLFLPFVEWLQRSYPGASGREEAKGAQFVKKNVLLSFLYSIEDILVSKLPLKYFILTIHLSVRKSVKLRTPIATFVNALLSSLSDEVHTMNHPLLCKY